MSGKMELDFTLKAYTSFIKKLKDSGYSFHTFSEFLINPQEQSIVLRHDVDRLPANSLKVADLLSEMGIKATFYFRIKNDVYDEEIIYHIAKLGHEVGYHYEDVSHTYLELKRRENKVSLFENKLIDASIRSFEMNLNRLREITSVHTICMHGSPLSSVDNRLLWKYYDYSDFDTYGEPYFDVDLENTLYLTDTGRCWDGASVSIRDKATESEISYSDWRIKPLRGGLMDMTKSAVRFQNQYTFHSTSEIMHAAKKSELPGRIMITFHPQRWTDNIFLWGEELGAQNLKNVVKYIFNGIRRI
jgi:hypothetical protein